MIVGLDFGTTNSAVALPSASGEVTLAPLDGGGTYRSVLYFDPEERGPDRRPLAFGGREAIDRFHEGDGGRLLQSLKSHLASRVFSATSIFGVRYTLEDLVARLVRLLLAKAEVSRVRAVVGRPVHFVSDEADDEGDARAEARLRQALLAAGLDEVVFELEPVAAAWRYERRLDHDELVLIADFGGGTTDLCLVQVGPGQRGRGRERVVGTDGVGLAGDAFDQRLLERVVAPHLGLGTRYRVFDGMTDVPLWLYQHLSRWHLLSFLKTQKTERLLAEIHAGADAPEAIARFQLLVEEDLGLGLHRAVEDTKVALSSADHARLSFPDLDLDVSVARADFEAWIAPDVARMGEAVDRLLARTGASPDDVDRVFLTGGTSLVPLVRHEFGRRFGEQKLVGGEELTTVASGLALRALEELR